MHEHILLSHPCKVFKAQLGNANLCFEEVNMSTKLSNGVQWCVELKQQPTYLKPTHYIQWCRSKFGAGGMLGGPLFLPFHPLLSTPLPFPLFPSPPSLSPSLPSLRSRPLKSN